MAQPVSSSASPLHGQSVSPQSRFISGPCGICCGEARYSDGRWCESCGKTGTAHIMLPEAVVVEVERLREALRGLLEPLGNLNGYRVHEQGPFLAHVESIRNRVMEALSDV